MSKTIQNIQTFVAEKVNDDLQWLYSPGMACFLFKDSATNFRLPKKGEDYTVTENKNTHWLIPRMTRFGVTGWNYREKVSYFVSIDIDLAGTKKIDGVSQERMDEIINATKKLPYLEVRYSTHGKGLLIRAFMDGFECPDAATHKKIAKSLIGRINKDTTLDLKLNKDIDKYGEVAWIWSNEQNDNSFKVISYHTEDYVPDEELANEVQKAKAPVVKLDLDFDAVEEEAFFLSLSETTQQCLAWIRENGGLVSYECIEEEGEEPVQCIKLHTAELANAQSHFKLGSSFKTVSSGSKKGDINAFAVPTNGGGLRVIRFGGGNEKEWMTDDKGRSFCIFNDITPLIMTVKRFNGQPDSDDGYLFDSLQDAINCINVYSKEEIECPPVYSTRKTKIVILDASSVQVRIDKMNSSEMPMVDGWHKGRGYLKCTYPVFIPEDKEYGMTEDEMKLLKENVRHIVLKYNTSNTYWEVQARSAWVKKGTSDVDAYVTSFGHSKSKATAIRGSLIRESLFGMDVPFGPDILGKNLINITNAKFAVKPEKGKFETWKDFLGHVGRSLTPYIKGDPVCQGLGIHTGFDYLATWIAMSIRDPAIRLPYLFLYGEQESGKSMFHESLRHLISSPSVARGDRTLTDPKAFNGDLLGSTHIVLEEVDFSNNPLAYNRLKDYVTAEEISIRALYMDAMMVPNYTHWIQVANDISFCPIEDSDTRITMIYVEKPFSPRPKHELRDDLRKEAPAFLEYLLRIVLPEFKGRLGMPIVTTDARDEVMADRGDSVKNFVDECLMSEDAAYETLGSVYEAYQEQTKHLKGSVNKQLSKRGFSRRIQEFFPKGRSTKLNGQVIVGNCFLINKPSGLKLESKIIQNGEWITCE